MTARRMALRTEFPRLFKRHTTKVAFALRMLGSQEEDAGGSAPVMCPGSHQSSLPWRFPSELCGAHPGPARPAPLRIRRHPRGSGFLEQMESRLAGKTKDLHSAGWSLPVRILFTCPHACLSPADA